MRGVVGPANMAPEAVAWWQETLKKVTSTKKWQDDYIKVNKAHNRGIFWKKKSYVMLAISMGIAWWLVAATRISRTARTKQVTRMPWVMT